MTTPNNADKDLEAFHSLLEKNIYHPEELAELLGMDIDVIYQAAHRGNLKALKIGHDIISFTRADVVVWLTNR